MMDPSVLTAKALFSILIVEPKHGYYGNATGHQTADDYGQNNEPVGAKDAVDVLVRCFHGTGTIIVYGREKGGT